MSVEGQRRVLVVEDDADIREGVRWLLEERGFAVDFASHGAEALDWLRDDANPRPDVILLDLMMPVMDGWAFRAELAREEALAEIPLVIVSAVSDREPDELHVPGVRVVGRLDKPLSLEGLLETVARLFRAPRGKH